MIQNTIHLQEHLVQKREQLRNHKLYSQLTTIDDLARFTESHVFAVWDYMSLLKFLQRELTCVSVPWLPKKEASVARFINEIVHGEESDIGYDGKPQSHFEMYVSAMQELNANTSAIKALIEQLQQGKELKEVISNSAIPKSAQHFMANTFETIENGKLHEVAASFTFGREDLIPDMFLAIIDKAEQENQDSSYPKLKYYLQRHIELDGDEHGPLSMKLITQLCGKSNKKWQEAYLAAKKALAARIQLWNTILDEIEAQQTLICS